MPRKLFFVAALLCLFISPAQALDNLNAFVPKAEMVGKGIFTYALWDIYEARLYAPEGKWNPDKPFALSIEYFRTFKGSAIADRSVQEMRKQGFTNEMKLAAWNAQMKKIFPNVTSGSVLTAIYTPNAQTTFYDGDKLIGTVKDDEFGRKFFDIWLSPRTSEPQLRRTLLGLS